MREISQYQTPGHWLDMDMLEIGNGDMTVYQQQTHFAFWAALKSPLIIGADLSKLSNESVAVLRNKDIIALNQDSMGQAVHYIESASNEGSWQVWAGQVKGGYVVLLLNEKSYPQDLSVSFVDLELDIKGPVKTTELWSHKSFGKVDGYKGVLQPYQTLVFRLQS
jgi:alpha-galactosidase